MMDDGVKCVRVPFIKDTDLMHDKIRECDILINGTCVGMALPLTDSPLLQI